MDERWLPVVGYEGLYEVSDVGDIRSVDRMKPNRWGGNSQLRGHAMAAVTDSDGYRVVNLYRAGHRQMLKAHRIVLEAFVGPCPHGLQCLHEDDVRSHNAIGNLSWGTAQKNISARDANGRGPRGERNAKAKLTREAVLAIRSDGRAQVVIAAAHGIDQTTVSNIKVRRTWAHVA